MTSWTTHLALPIAALLWAGALFAGPRILTPILARSAPGDLTPSISAFWSPGGVEIPNRAQQTYRGGAGAIRVKVTVSNTGGAPVGSFTSRVRITLNRSIVVDESFTLPGVERGAAAERWYDVSFRDSRNVIHADAEVDSGRVIREVSETNNRARFDCALEAPHLNVQPGGDTTTNPWPGSPVLH